VSRAKPNQEAPPIRAGKTRRKTGTVPYDAAEQLRTPEEMAACLDAWSAKSDFAVESRHRFARILDKRTAYRDRAFTRNGGCAAVRGLVY
jgi:hypothetical protein